MASEGNATLLDHRSLRTSLEQMAIETLAWDLRALRTAQDRPETKAWTGRLHSLVVASNGYCIFFFSGLRVAEFVHRLAKCPLRRVVLQVHACVSTPPTTASPTTAADAGTCGDAVQPLAVSTKHV